MVFRKHVMPLLGTIAGDIIGAPYELKGTRIKHLDFQLFVNTPTFTDDTVLSLAIAQWIISDGLDLKDIVLSICRNYMHVGYGHSFKGWLRSEKPKPYQSFGNGSAMRVSSIGTFASNINSALNLAERSAIITHNHIEGIKGAQAVTIAIHLAYNGFPKNFIKEYIQNKFKYNLSRSIEEIRKTYSFDSSCQGSVPEAIIAFIESHSVEHAIRLAISLGGDADTQASIAGAIAAAYYKEIPTNILNRITDCLTYDLYKILDDFNNIELPKQEKSIFTLRAKQDVYLNGEVRYRFALATTDHIQVLIPKDTMLYIETIGSKCVYCKILTHKEQISQNIERELGKKYAELKDDYEYLCNGIALTPALSELYEFYVRDSTTDDILRFLD